MEKGKRIWKYLCVVAVLFLLGSVSVFTVFAEETEVIVTEDWAEFSLSLPKEDMATRLYTFVIRNEKGEEVGKVELRYGRETNSEGSMGILLWITTDGKTEKISNLSNFRVGSRLRIKKEVWKDYFKEEFYTYERSEQILETTNPIKQIWFSEDGWFHIEWNLEEANNENQDFNFKMYRDGEFIGNTHIYAGKNKEDKLYWVDYINESGEYTASAKATGIVKTVGDSEKIFSTNSYQYVRPKTDIGQVSEIRWSIGEGETIPTVIEWDPVEGAGKYDVRLRIYQDGKNIYTTGSVISGKGETNQPMRFDWIKNKRFTDLRVWAEKEGVEIKAEVRPLSPDIEKIANGGKTVEEEYRPYQEKIKEITESLMDITADSVLQDVEEVGVDKVAAAMQRDDAFLKQMETLEKELIERDNIKVEPPIIDAATGLDSEKIEIVGAAMNTVSGGAVTVSFKEVKKEEEEKVDEVLYQNAVQVNISLSGDSHTQIEQKGELLAPITITMTPPEKVDLSKLVILHYHAQGKTPERIYPVFREDGRITFSVTKFSTFVFAEMVSYTGESTNPNPPTEPTKPSNPSSGSDEEDSDSDSGYNTVSNQGVQTSGMTKRFLKADGSTAKSEWVTANGKWYYAQEDGTLKTGWYQNKAGVWYYLQENCEMAANWQLVNGKWYYLDSVNGDMKTNWLHTADGKWYYLDPKNGDMAEGWKLVNSKWYYFNPKSGDMASGWQKISGKWYFLTKEGDCLLNTVTPDGYQVDKDGAWIQ